jgi:hypothetical protein
MNLEKAQQEIICDITPIVARLFETGGLSLKKHLWEFYAGEFTYPWGETVIFRRKDSRFIFSQLTNLLVEFKTRLEVAMKSAPGDRENIDNLEQSVKDLSQSMHSARDIEFPYAPTWQSAFYVENDLARNLENRGEIILRFFPDPIWLSNQRLEDIFHD